MENWGRFPGIVAGVLIPWWLKSTTSFEKHHRRVIHERRHP
jgi:hypothetical protein